MLDRSGRVFAMSVLLLSWLAAPMLFTRAFAQDDAPAARRTEDQPKQRSRSRGRLPMYFSKVVNQEQREEIYEIQAKFEQQIADLMEQVREIEKQRDEEVHAVLTPDQQKEVAAMVEDARKRRQALRDAEAAVEEEEDEAGEQREES